MAHYDIEFPLNDLEGPRTAAGPGFDTSVITMDSGQESRVQRRGLPRRRYDVATQIRTIEDLKAVLDFYLRVGGVANSWLYKDPIDHNSTEAGYGTQWTGGQAITANDQVIGTGDGSTTQFQLIKTYGDSSPQYVRTIQKPDTGTVKVALDGVEQPSGWTVDRATGIITFTTAPAIGEVVSAGYEFFVPCRFDERVDEALRVSLEAYDIASITSIPIIEVLLPDEDREPFFYRGYYSASVSSDVTLSVQTALFWNLNPNGASVNVLLPAKATTPAGGPLFIVVNTDTGSGQLVIKDSDTNALLTILTAGQAITLYLGADPNGGLKWYGL